MGAFEKVWLYREIELDLDTSGPLTLHVVTEMPELDLRERYSFPVNTEETTAGRRTYNVRWGGTLKGHLIQLRLDGSNSVRLYGVRIYAKPLSTPSAWAWYGVFVVETSEAWLTAALPIKPTPVEYSTAELPIVGVGPWQTAKLPIDGTEDGWRTLRIPLPQTPLEPSWVDIPVDVIE